MNKVIVDTDFLNHIIRTPNGASILEKIIIFFDYELLIHPWTYERELVYTDVKKFVDKNVKILTFDDIILDEGDNSIYESLFKVLFEEMNGRSVDFGRQNFKTYNKSGENLGEIHSVIAAQFLGIPLLLSDDYHAKETAARRLNFLGYNLNVKNSFDLLCEMIIKDKSNVSKDDAIKIIKNYKERYHEKYIKQIKELYKRYEA